VSARVWTLSSVFLLTIAQSLCAGGAYQWTEDRRKALVWNNDPQPGDTASWSGQRDQDGYATGPGTLSWYRFSQGFTTGSNLAIAKKKVPISTYSGTMMRGKFNGGVMTVDHGKTYHATFVDGRRKGGWSAGPLITKAESAEAPSTKEKTETAEGEKENAEAPTSNESSAKTSSAVATAQRPNTEEGTADIPAEGPASTSVEKTQTPSSKSKTEDSAAPATPLIAQASSDSAEESATPREPVTRKAALAPGSVRAIERPAAATTKKPEPARQKTEKIAKATRVEKSTPSQASKPESNEERPSEGPAESESAASTSKSQTDLQAPKLKSQKLASEATKPQPKETPADDSIESLVGPPPSLRSEKAASAPAATAPAAANTSAASSPPATTTTAASPAAGATKLTAVNAMDIADIEARTRGFDLGEYELPKAEYNAATDTWSVNYAPRDANAKKLSVTVQDKNGKAEIKK
jgi:hypothetical protein